MESCCHTRCPVAGLMAGGSLASTKLFQECFPEEGAGRVLRVEQARPTAELKGQAPCSGPGSSPALGPTKWAPIHRGARSWQGLPRTVEWHGWLRSPEACCVRKTSPALPG